MIEDIDQDQILGQRTFDCVTPDFVLSQIKDNPILCNYWRKNAEDIQSKLVEVFLRTPSKSDCPGYIYGFRNKTSYNSKDRKYEIKMGRTKKQNPQERIFEWQKEDGHEYVQIFTVRSEHNMKLQALVHIIFAYARKTLIINNKRRIQWFQFDQKVPTAAVTNILNLLMEKVHEKDLQKLKPSDNLKFIEEYNLLMAQLLSGQKIMKEKRRFAIFGLPKTGKTIISHILSDNALKVVKNGKNLQIVSSNKNISKQILQIRPIISSDKIEIIKRYFLNWFTLCNSQSLIPVLIIKQSDVESSISSGYSQGIKLINQFLSFQTSPIVLINRVKNNFNQEGLADILAENKKFISQKHSQFMQKSQYIFLPEASYGDRFLTEDIQTELKEKLLNFNNLQKNPSIKMSFSPEYTKMCHEIIEFLYPKLQKIYSNKFKKQQSTISQEINHLNLINFLRQKINILKTNKHLKNRQVFVIIKQINDNLDFSYEQDIESYLYVFCECTLNNSLIYTLIFSTILQNINEKCLQIIESSNRDILQVIKEFKQGLQFILIKHEDKSFINILQSIVAESNQSKMHYYLNQLIDFKFADDNSDIKKAMNIIANLDLQLIKFQEYARFGLKLNSTFGRIKESVFLALKSLGSKPIVVVKQHKSFKEELRMSQKVKEPSKSNQEWIIDEAGQFKIVTKCNTLILLFDQIKKINQGETVVNIFNGQFKINHSSIIKNNIYVLAKKIVVEKDWKMRFSTNVEAINNLNMDIQLVFIAESWTGINRLTVPKISKGAVYILKMSQGKIQTMQLQNAKNANHLRKNILEHLKNLYLSKIT